jgi:hypothetical protein
MNIQWHFAWATRVDFAATYVHSTTESIRSDSEDEGYSSTPESSHNGQGPSAEDGKSYVTTSGGLADESSIAPSVAPPPDPALELRMRMMRVSKRNLRKHTTTISSSASSSVPGEAYDGGSEASSDA